MIGFFQIMEDNLCKNFSNITRRKQKNAPSNLTTDQKMDTTPQIFQKKLQRIVYLCLCYGQASCWVSVQCKFSHFLVGLRYCKLALLHYCVQETSGGTGMLHVTEITPHILKPSSKKQMAFMYVAYKFLQKKFRAVL